MSTFWNDLPCLENIVQNFNVKKFNNKNIEDFKESIMFFIDDYIKSKPRDYEVYKFRKILNSSIYNIIVQTYGCIVDSISLSIDIVLNECIDLYFLINDNPRSFKRTFIIS